MQEGLQSLWMRLSIVEAKIQQERSRIHADPVRLALLKQMKSTLEQDIRCAELTDIGPQIAAEAVRQDFPQRPAA